MNKAGPLLVIEDDMDDQEVLIEIFKKLKYENEVLYFSDGNKAFEYLVESNVKPFLILSDINMPKLNGFELRNKILTNNLLNAKCIPYLFFSTSSAQSDIVTAYSSSAQGFFVKPANYNDLERTINKIVEYWKECISPDFSEQVVMDMKGNKMAAIA